MNCSNNSDEVLENKGYASAYSISKVFVSQNLNFPEEADFPWGPIAKDSIDANTFRVIGEVTGKNGFGVKIKKKYTCILTYDGIGESTDTRSWNLISLEFNP